MNDEQLRRLRLTPLRTAAVGLSIVAMVLVIAIGNASRDGESQDDLKPQPTETVASELAISRQVADFCGACHAVPSPSSFPRDAWYAEVRQGFNFYYGSGRHDLSVPLMDDVVAYYRDRAPEQISLPKADNTNGPLTFRAVGAGSQTGAPAVSCIDWSQQPIDGGGGDMLVCDMHSGELSEIRFPGQTVQSRVVARLANPARVTRADLDGDGIADLIVSDLGSFLPDDHELGRVVWFSSRFGGDGSPMVIYEKCGRVADVQPADFDGDGDLDLFVAEFGWRQTGRIVLLENISVPDELPRFQSRLIDERHGTIHVPIADLNNDGRPDFVALISQEHEVIEGFVNQGDGTFRKNRIFDAADPAFGSSGIQLVDLDQDGDLDILYTNGDTLDSHYLKPSHGIHWLENRGEYPFHHHVLTKMPGVCRALACDLDNDGDLDVAACAAILHDLRKPPEEGVVDSLIWLEQTEPGEFVRHSIMGPEGGFLALEVGDFDCNGTIDIATGRFSSSASNAVTIWWNEGAAGTAEP